MTPEEVLEDIIQRRKTAPAIKSCVKNRTLDGWLNGSRMPLDGSATAENYGRLSTYGWLKSRGDAQ